MSNATAAPRVAPNLQISKQSSVEELIREVDKTQRVVFYAGNFMTSDQEEQFGFHLGGMMFLGTHTVPNEYVPRCAITPLKEGMMSVRGTLINPKERKNYIRSYQATNIWNPMTQEFETVTVGTSGMSRGLLFKKIYPSQEIGAIAGQNNGVVEIPGLDTVEKIRDSQLHFFPDWMKYLEGLKSFPRLLRELQETFETITDKTTGAEMRAVGRAMLKSCTDFRKFGTRYIAAQSLAIEQSKKTDGIQVYDEIGERFFVMLELTRQDSLIKDFVKNNNQTGQTNEQLTQAITLLTQLLIGQQGAQTNFAPAIGQTVPPESKPQSPLAAGFSGDAQTSIVETDEADEADDVDEAAEAAEAAAELKENSSVNSVATELTPEIVALGCSDYNKNNEPCGGRVTKLVDGLGYCGVHPKGA